jgi:hypothetical protein
MELLSKKLGKGEINWKGIVIPRNKTNLFPAPGIEFDLQEGRTTFKAKMDNHSRLRLSKWFRQHRSLKPGDEIKLSRQNGTIKISLSRSFSRPEKETFEWMIELIEAVRNGEIEGHVHINKKGFYLEIGEHIKETQVSLEINGS